MKHPLQICMISPHFPPDFGWYGNGRESLELAYELRSQGHVVTVIACADGPDAGITFQDGYMIDRVQWKKSPREGSLAAHCLPRSRLLMNMNLALWRAYLKHSKKMQFDIVDVCGSSAECLIPTLSGDTPVFARVYDEQPHFLKKELSIIGDSGFSFERKLKVMLRKISTSYASVAREEIKDSHLNYSLDTDYFTPVGVKALDTGGRPTVLAYTSISDPHYQALLVETFSKVKEAIPDLYLIVVAHDIYTESSEADLKKVLTAGGIDCDMVINRNMSRLLMPSLWRSSQCGLLLNWQEFAPHAVLEPLSCAVPILVESAGNNMSFLKTPGLLVEPKEFTGTAIAEKLIELLKDQSLSESIGKKARQYILENHCRKNRGAEVLQSYLSAVESYTKERQRLEKIDRLERFLAHCQELSDSLDQMLYDFLFLHSVRFRVSHWLRKLKAKPAAKPTHKVSK